MVRNAVIVALVGATVVGAIGLGLELPSCHWPFVIYSDQACNDIVRGISIDAASDVQCRVGMINIGNPVISVHAYQVGHRFWTLRLDCYSEEIIIAFQGHFFLLELRAVIALNLVALNPLSECSLAVDIRLRRRWELLHFGCLLTNSWLPRIGGEAHIMLQVKRVFGSRTKSGDRPILGVGLI